MLLIAFVFITLIIISMILRILIILIALKTLIFISTFLLAFKKKLL